MGAGLQRGGSVLRPGWGRALGGEGRANCPGPRPSPLPASPGAAKCQGELMSIPWGSRASVHRPSLSGTLLQESDQCPPQPPSFMKAFCKRGVQKLHQTPL